MKISREDFLANLEEMEKTKIAESTCMVHGSYKCGHCGSLVEFSDDPSGLPKARTMWEKKLCRACVSKE